MEDDSDSQRPARKRPRSPEAGDEPPPASTAGRRTSGSTTTTADADANAENTADADADDVILERENTAWDVLEARFKQNAREGNYFDLTDEAAGDGGRALSVADAEEAVEAMRRSDAEYADEATAISAGNGGGSNDGASVAAVAAAAPKPPAATSASEPRQSPIIRGFNNMIHDTITELQEARQHLE